MNIRAYVLRFVVTITAFFLGFSAHSGSQYVSSYFQTTPFVHAAEENITVAAEPVAETLVPMTGSTAEVETIDYDFSNQTGEYYLSQGKLPLEFRDLEYLEIVTHVYNENSDHTDYTWDPVPARGSIHAKREYKFKTVSVSPVYLTFETEVKNGISYRFVGQFRAPNASYDDYDKTGDLKGKLQKLKDGVVTRSIQAVFYVPGC
jgi:hypothetical protein